MRVRAKHNVTYNGVWKHNGDVFDIDLTDTYMLPYVETLEAPTISRNQYESSTEAQGPDFSHEQKRRGRPRKTETENQ